MFTHTTHQLTDHISYLSANHETDRPGLAAIRGNRSTLLVDAGNSPAHAQLLLELIENKRAKNISSNNTSINTTKTPTHPTFVVLTHWHWDHIFGMQALNMPVIAQQHTDTMIRELMTYDWTDEALDQRVDQGIEVTFCSDMIKKEFAYNREEIQLIPPHIIFQDKLTLDLGGLTCHIDRVGGDHTQDSTVVYVEEEKTLFLGDCLAPDLYVPDWTFTVEGVLKLVTKLSAYDAEIIVESHSEPVDKKTFAQQLEDLRQTALAVEKCGSDKEQVHATLQHTLGRTLQEEDLETIQFFINGLKTQKTLKPKNGRNTNEPL